MAKDIRCEIFFSLTKKIPHKLRVIKQQLVARNGYHRAFRKQKKKSTNNADPNEIANIIPHIDECIP